jgi:hypothetical protein
MKHDLEFQATIGALDRISLQPKIREGLETLVRELMAINDQFQKELYTIKMDDRYSGMGRDLLTQQLGDNVLDKLQSYAEAYKPHMEGVKKSLFETRNNPKSDTEILINYLKNQEIRSMHGMATMDPLEIEAKIDDPLFLEAVVTSPKPLLPADRLNELVAKKAEKANPESAQLLDQYSFADTTVKSLLSTIKADIKASGWKAQGITTEKPPAPVDAIAALAA